MRQVISSCTTLFALSFATSAFAQTSFPEVEPNSQKSEADPVVGITAGDSITGTTTGFSTTLGSTLVSTVDVFRVKTAPLPIALYQHRLTLTSADVTAPTGTIRGLSQTGTAGVGGIVGTTDLEAQRSSTFTSPVNFNQWYGFGKQEEIYYRVEGSGVTANPYTATMTTTTITPTVIAPSFEAGEITFTTVGQTFVDTELLLYDSAFNYVYQNDHEYPLFSAQSKITRTLAPGTYYLGVSTFELCTNQPAPADDRFFGFLVDFPDCVVLSSSSTSSQDYDFQVKACNGIHSQINQSPGLPFDVTWFQVNVVAGAPPVSIPPNDSCASALPLNVGTFTANIATATNDGAASCDPGGVSSKDLWYTFNAGSGGGLLDLSTCSTTSVDTVISVFNACGGTELACSDNCGGTPCGGTSSCISGLALAPNQVVRVRISDKGLGGCDFTLDTSYTPIPPSNDDCATPIVLSGPGTYPIDTSAATTGTQGQSEGLCLFFGTTAIPKDVWFTYTATQNGTCTVTTCGGILAPPSPSEDSKISVYGAAGCPTVGSSVACNDDFSCPSNGFNSTVSFATTCGTTYTFQLGYYGNFAQGSYFGTFSVSETGTQCSTPSTAFCEGDAVGTTCVACGNNGAAGRGCANSGFASGTLLANSGIASVSADTLVLTTSSMTGPGLFFQANGLAASPIGFGDGMLCAASGILRLGVVFPTAGSASYPGGLTPNPITVGGGPIVAGDTKHYQCWYRDAIVFCTASTFNTSNGISLVWVP